jgi:hypothetical protein
MADYEANTSACATEQKLAKDPCAILSGAEIRVLDREVRRALVSSLPGSKRTWPTARMRLAGMPSASDAARLAVPAGFVMCQGCLASLNTDCGRLRAGS